MQGESFKDQYEHLPVIVERSFYIVGCGLWEEKFESLLAIVKKEISDLWEVRKVKLFGVPGSMYTQPPFQSLAGATVVGGQRRVGNPAKFSHIFVQRK